MAQALPKRSDVLDKETWDLSKLFTSDESARQVIKEVSQDVINFKEKYQDRIQKDGGQGVVNALKDYEKLIKRFYRVGTYANLRTSTDMSDTEALRLMGEFSQAAAKFGAELSFFADELSKLKSETLAQAQDLAPEYATYLGDIAAWQKHMLKPELEEALAKLQPIMGLPSQVYDISKAADMKFPDFEVAGKTYPLSFVLYESHYCEYEDTEVRRKAFEAFSEGLRNYHNTNATIYNAQVQKEKIISELRGFDSVIDFLLFHQKVPRSLYDNHLDITMEKFAPVMRRWAKVLQKKHGLDEMHYSDLKLVYETDKSPNISIEDAKDYIRKAMEPMGEKYTEMVMRFDEERWVDFARNQGKSTGGFCTVPNKAQPYILLNWNDSVSELYTLAHELGHAAQGLLCQEHNAYLEADMTWYDVEGPSTFHEMLLSYSLIKQAEAAGDKEAEALVYANMIENTYYHNFVTHFIEGYYQREVYRRVDKGDQLQAQDFDQIFKETLEKFWGDAVILDEGAELTWMRQPHYYMGLYPYTYSASLVISTEMYRRLREEGEAVAEDWLKFMSTGGPTPPIEHAKLAKIDISDSKSLERTIDFIESLVAKLENLQA